MPKGEGEPKDEDIVGEDGLSQKEIKKIVREVDDNLIENFILDVSKLSEADIIAMQQRLENELEKRKEQGKK
jgi:hypothetical protein